MTSKPSRFAALAQTPARRPAAEATESLTPKVSTTAKAREGKKPVMGYFSPEVRKTLHLLTIEEDTTIQALLGEALDLLMRSRGKHPFGER